MNANEVISNRAIDSLAALLAAKNLCTLTMMLISHNLPTIAFPTFMHVAAVAQIREQLLPALQDLRKTFAGKAKDFANIVKIGRTH